MKTTLFDRLLLFVTVLVAAYQVVVGIDGLSTLSVTAYTVGFGVLLVAGLLIIILGFEVLDSPLVVIVSTVIPLSISLGLMWEFVSNYRVWYLVFALLGFLAVVLTRSLPVAVRWQTLVLAAVHGVSGLVIFLLPLALAFQGQILPGFALVGLGGGLIGLGGLLLSFLKVGRPILPRETVFKILPSLLLLMTAAFVAGFAFR